MIDPKNPDYKNTPVADQRPTFTYVAQVSSSEPAVSVVTPFFNTGPVFHETARSLLRQSFQQWEWLIVNDGSTDAAALAVLETYRQQDPRIRVLDLEENKGPGAARNMAFRAARAPYIVQLDSDNLLEPTAIEIWYWFLQSFPEYSFVKGYTVGFGAEEYLWNRGFHNGEAFLYANQVDATAMFRREMLADVGGYDEAIRDGLEDWDFWLRCANAGHWGSTVHQYMDWYRRRPSHAERWQDWDGGSRQESFRRGLRQRYPALWNGAFPKIDSQPWVIQEPSLADLPEINRLSKSRPRLLMILPWLTMGGSDRFNLNLVQQLQTRGWEVTIATTLGGDHSWEPEFAAHTPDIFALHRFLRLADYPRFLSYLARSRQVDCVLISHSELGYQLLPYLRAQLPETAFVDYCHLEEIQWKNGGYPRMAISYQELLDLNIVSSAHLREWMAAQGASVERIRLCYTGIELREDLSPTVPAAEMNGKQKPPLIVYAGRICEQKQPKVFARTMERLAEMNAPFRAVVAGDGPDKAWLASFIRQKKLDRQVQLLGELSHQQLLELLTTADIFFLPSLWEGISLAIYEAMAAGLAVVGADVGGQRELVTEECGILIRPGREDEEVERYAAALAGLLQQPEKARKMGRMARSRIAAGFRLDQMGDRMVELLREAISQHQSDPRPLPPAGLARATASQAIEYVRMSHLADQLWMERHGHRPKDGGAQSANWTQLDWRRRLYLTLYRWHEPIYHWYNRRGWDWLAPVREQVRSLLLSRYDSN